MSHPPSISPPTAGAATSAHDTGHTRDVDRERLAVLAAEFESMLLLEMIKTMRQSMLDEEGEGDGYGADTFSSTIDSELARHLSGAGVGLQQYILEAWDRGLVPGAVARSTDAVANPSAVTLAPAVTSATAARASSDASALGLDDPGLELAGRVSSGFGWRRDPFTGQSRFHRGIDLAASYGTDVPAAAEGTVTAAGEQGGYGLTVVVTHRDGYQTRYAHLSSIDIEVGETVEQGRTLGRVGSTGRSTAPHLHFEVLRAGQRIDPDRFVRNLAGDTKGQ